MFRYGDGREFAQNFPLPELPYVSRAASYGFALKAHTDITPNVAPTIDLAHGAFQTYAHPPLALLSQPLPKSLGSRPLLRPLVLAKERILEIQRYYERRLDPQYFRNHVRYAILLFQKTD
jgi:hypothetical protein